MENKLKSISNLKHFKKGADDRRNLGGRPKGISTAKRKQNLKKLIKDLSVIMDTLTVREKLIAYQLYEIVENDLATSISSSVDHLYFMESEFGIKIGKSKNPDNRLKQVKIYAPSTKLIKVIKYAGNFEIDVHNKFSHINIKNNPIIGIEWFLKSDDLYSFILENDKVNDMHKYFNPKGNGQIKLF